MSSTVALGLGVWLLCGGVCAAINHAKGGNPWTAFALGCLLGLFAVGYYAFLVRGSPAEQARQRLYMRGVFPDVTDKPDNYTWHP